MSDERRRDAADIRRYIVDSFLLGQGDGDLDDDESLIDSGILDSTGVVEMVTYLEETYGIEVDDDDLVPENLDSIARLAALVERKRIERSAMRGAENLT